jgi:peptide/nickel transport system substrate-binding protein
MLTKHLAVRRSLAVLAAGMLAAALAACSSGSSSGSSASSGSASGSSGSQATLTMESSPENTITDDFNPFVPTNPIQGMGPTGLIYEPLIQFDLANPTVSYPWLATKYAFSNDGKAITFTIRTGVKWSNGTALTPADVAFTFNEVKKYPDINSGGLNISSVTTSGDTVTVNFPTSQYMNLENIAGQAIIPEAIWSKVGDPAKYTDANPVGTGPYVLGSFTQEGVTMTANPHYWQSVPVKKVYFPVYTSNTGALTALFSGQITWTGNYIPGLQQKFVDPSPSTHHFWEAAGSSNAVIPNLNEWPTNQLPVRQAISAALNRSAIGEDGEAGLETALTNSTGITLPTYSAWASPVASMTQSGTSDPSAAKSILEKAGWTLKNGFFYQGGKELSLTIVEPTSYTDYAADASLVAQQLKAAGINVSYDGVSVNAWDSDVSTGDFQLTIHWSSGGITPYQLYDNWLDDTLVTPSSATGDYERLKDPAIEADLQKLNSDKTVAEQATDLAPIEKYVATNLPVIPTTTAADWFEYDSQDFTGWPTQSDPYDSGQPSGTNNGPGSGTDEVVLLHLKAAS